MYMQICIPFFSLIILIVSQNNSDEKAGWLLLLWVGGSQGEPDKLLKLRTGTFRFT